MLQISYKTNIKGKGGWLGSHMLLWYMTYIIATNDMGWYLLLSYMTYIITPNIGDYLGCYMMLCYITYIIASNNGGVVYDPCWNNMPPWWFQVLFHICHMLQRSYKTDIKGKGGDGMKIRFENMEHDVLIRIYLAHMVLIAMRQVQCPFLFFICRRPAGIFGMNLRSTTVVCYINWVLAH